MFERQALREVRSRVVDSARWAGYKERPDDIVIATAPKCGTTWMQRIVRMLVFKSAEPNSIWEDSPWPDMRLFGPIEETWARAEAQTHRRFFKTHLPYEAIPVAVGMKFIHVGRDGRDAALSMHNHQTSFTPEVLARFDEISMSDPKFGTPYERVPRDPADYFHLWVSDENYNGDGDPATDFFHTESSYWAARHHPNMLLVHYADLKQDLGGEMRRIADFLDIDIAESLWPRLIEAAGFETMRSQGAQLLPKAQGMWQNGASSFLNRGTNGRWQQVFRKEDLELYEAKLRDKFEPELARWIQHGRLESEAAAA